MRRDIGEVLVENGQITDEELKRALQQVETIAEPIGRALLRLGLVSEDSLKTVLEAHYGFNYVDLKTIAPDSTIISLLPQKMVLQYDIVPVRTAGSYLTLAMVSPSDSEALAKVKAYLKDWQLHLVVCSDDGFQNFVSRAYGQSQSIQEISTRNESTELVEGQDVGLLEQGVNKDLGMILLSRYILSNAINKGCTSIHVEPNDRQVLVHYRKEGVLFPARKLPKSILPELVQRFQIMAAKIPDAAILPYDGVLNVCRGQVDFSFRLSTVPGVFGEHLVIWLE